MFKWLADRAPVARRVREEEKGFTLIELLVVIIIIGILAAIAIPTFLAQRERSFEAAAQSDLRNLASSATTCASANDGNYSTCNQATLQSTYDFNPSADVVTATPTTGASQWVGTAKHANATTTYRFDSNTGTITP